MRNMRLVAFFIVAIGTVACASDPPPREREPTRGAVVPYAPPPARTVSEAERQMREAMDRSRAAHDAEVARGATVEQQTRATLERDRADRAAAEKAEQERRAIAAQHAEEQAQRDAVSHVAECKQSFATRLRSAQALLPQVVTKKASVQTRCRTLQPHCAIANRHSACAGVSADDAEFYEGMCMRLPYPDQFDMFDEANGCGDVDPVSLHVTFATASAQLDAIRNAKP